MSSLAAAAKRARVLKASTHDLYRKLREPMSLTARKTKYRILESVGCRRIVLTGKEKGNSLDRRTAEAIEWKLRSYEDNYLIKAVMLAGQKSLNTFSSGWDTSAAHKDAFRRYNQLAYVLATSPKPTISWYNGKIMGAGLGLGLTRYRISTESSSFEVTGPDHGWGLDGGMSFFLPRLKAGSLAFARYLCLTGTPISGVDMIASGLSTHHAKDEMADLLHLRMADLVYESDDLVEDVLTDASSMFYKLDPVLNPSYKYYQELAIAWEKNDEERIRMLKIAATGLLASRSYESMDEEEGELGEDVLGPGQYDDQEMEEMGKEAMSKVDKDLTMEDEEEKEMKKFGYGEDTSAVADLPLPEGLDDDEDEEARLSQKHTKKHYKTLWWHKNFAEGDEAVWAAICDDLKSQAVADLSTEDMKVLSKLVSKFSEGGGFPQYLTYPERTRLVDADRVLLSPWNCTVDPKERFPAFMELMGRVNVCFKGDSLEEIIENLKTDDSPWAQDCLKRMDQRTPGSLKIVFKQLEEGSELEIEDCFRMDHRVGHRLLTASSDERKALGTSLHEGGALHALPSISDEHVASLFQDLPANEELDLGERLNGKRKEDKILLKRFHR